MDRVGLILYLVKDSGNLKPPNIRIKPNMNEIIQAFKHSNSIGAGFIIGSILMFAIIGVAHTFSDDKEKQDSIMIMLTALLVGLCFGMIL